MNVNLQVRCFTLKLSGIDIPFIYFNPIKIELILSQAAKKFSKDKF